MLAETEQWTDMPRHELLTPRDKAPLIETRVSKVMNVTMKEAFDHFFGSQPELRLDLHKDHVKAYHIHEETDDTLEYEYVFEAYGTRNWGRAAEVANRPHRIDVEVKDGPLMGQTVTTLFEEVEGGTEVTQINRVWPGDADLTVKLMGNKLKSQLAALAGVHLEQHRVDMETDGEQRFQDKFSKNHQADVAQKQAHPVKDFLATTRAVTLPIIILPLVAAAGIASQQGTYEWTSLIATLIGGCAALLGANILNDLYDFKGGADQSARTVPGQIETGSGAFVEGRWSMKKGWAMTALMFGLAAASGAWLAWSVTYDVALWALLGAFIAYQYIAPPLALAYKGRGLGEAAIFVAFGLTPIAGGVLAHGGSLDAQVWWIGSLFGMTAVLVLYHHHFLHWQADKLAGKGSPIAMMGPRVGAAVGTALVVATSLVVSLAVLQEHLPLWALVGAVTPLLLVNPQRKVAMGDVETPARVKVATAAFFVMILTNLVLAIGSW